MAKPIKNTPVLKGEDAIKFSEDIKKSEEKKVPADRFAKMKENFIKLQAIAESYAPAR